MASLENSHSASPLSFTKKNGIKSPDVQTRYWSVYIESRLEVLPKEPLLNIALKEVNTCEMNHFVFHICFHFDISAHHGQKCLTASTVIQCCIIIYMTKSKVSYNLLCTLYNQQYIENIIYTDSGWSLVIYKKN